MIVIRPNRPELSGIIWIVRIFGFHCLTEIIAINKLCGLLSCSERISQPPYEPSSVPYKQSVPDMSVCLVQASLASSICLLPFLSTRQYWSLPGFNVPFCGKCSKNTDDKFNWMIGNRKTVDELWYHSINLLIEKHQYPCGIRTHNLWIAIPVLYCCATTAAVCVLLIKKLLIFLNKNECLVKQHLSNNFFQEQN